VATPKIGDVGVFEIAGLLPPTPQRSVEAIYHPDGVELDATEVRGGPFKLAVIILATLDQALQAKDEIIELVAGEPVDVTIGDGTVFSDCQIGGPGPGASVVEVSRKTVDHAGTEEVLLTLAVAGHKLST